MSNWKPSVRALLAKVTLAALGLAIVAALAGWLARQERPYDVESVRSKFEKIGRALALYREESGTRPVEQWTRWSDAGLPPEMLWLATVRDRAWSIPEGSTVFEVENPTFPIKNKLTFHYPFNKRAFPDDNAVVDRILCERGLATPVLIDFNVSRRSDLTDTTKVMLKALVLRLDGRIELIEYDRRPVRLPLQVGALLRRPGLHGTG